MQPSIRLKVNVGGTRMIKLPEDVPEGPAEIIVFIEAPEAERERTQQAERRRRAMGTAAGQFAIPDDFDEPLPHTLHTPVDSIGESAISLPRCRRS